MRHTNVHRVSGAVTLCLGTALTLRSLLSPQPPPVDHRGGSIVLTYLIAALANAVSAATLTELRCSLFFEARRERHSGGISINEEWIRELLRAIRKKVEAGELD